MRQLRMAGRVPGGIQAAPPSLRSPQTGRKAAFLLSAMLVWGAGASLSLAQPAALSAPSSVDLQPGSAMWFEGTAGPVPYNCRIGHADVRTETGDVVLRVSIPVEDIDCGRKAMNRDMREALKADRHPSIDYSMTSYRLQDGDPLRIQAVGELTVAGRSRPIRIEASGERLPDRTLRIVGSHVIDMTWFGVDPPRPMMGLIQVDPNMLLRVDVKVPAAAGDAAGRY